MRVSVLSSGEWAMHHGSLRKVTPVKVPERRVEARYVGVVNGCYTLSSRRAPENRAVEVFACRAQSISSVAAAVTAPVAGDHGEWLTARFDGLGIIRGQIDDLFDDGFGFSISASNDQREKLAARIRQLKRRAVRVEVDKRGYERLQPNDPRSTIILPDGEVMRCFISDMSRSGAAVSADYVLELNASIVVGALACKVVRQLEVGFAVEFDAVQDAVGLEGLLTGYEPRPVGQLA